MLQGSHTAWIGCRRILELWGRLRSEWRKKSDKFFCFRYARPNYRTPNVIYCATWKSTVAAISGLVGRRTLSLPSVSCITSSARLQKRAPEIWGELAATAPVGAYAFMAFNLLCAPCFAAMGAIKREMNNGKWTALAIGYMCAYAYVVSDGL